MADSGSFVATKYPSISAMLCRSLFEQNEHAIAEFIDNSIQACRSVDAPRIDIHHFTNHKNATDGHGTSYMMVTDNGDGMDREKLENFATFSKTVEERGLQLDDDNTDANLSLFGVGAKSAAFHIGDRLVILTKSATCGVIRRLVLDRFELVRNEQENNAYNFNFESISCIENVLPEEDIENDPSCLFEKVKEHILHNKNQFTIMLLKLKNPYGRNELNSDHNKNIEVCSSLYDKMDAMPKALAEIYYFHLFPNASVTSTDAIKRVKLFPREERNNRITNKNLDMFYQIHFNNKEPSKVLNLKTEKSFLYSCFQQAKGQFKFQMKIADPVIPSKEHLVSCSLLYFPHETGAPTRPMPVRDEVCDRGDAEKVDTQSIMQVFWQKRLTPETRLQQFPFLGYSMGPNLSIGTGRPACANFRNRLVGLMFFDRTFKHISENKLKICIEDGLDYFLANLHQDRNNFTKASIVYTESNIVTAFEEWFKQCYITHDREIAFTIRRHHSQSRIPDFKSNKTYFEKLQFISDGNSKHVQSGDAVKWDSNGKTIFGEIVDFMVPLTNEDTYYGKGHIRYKRLPLSVFGEKTLASVDTSVIKKLLKGKPEDAEKIKQIEDNCVKRVKLFVFDSFGQSPREIVKDGDSFTVDADKGFHKFGVQLFNSSSTAVPVQEYSGGAGSNSTRKLVVQMTIGEQKPYNPVDILEYYDSNKKKDVVLTKEHLNNKQVTLDDCYFICCRSPGERSNIRIPVGRNFMKISVRCGDKSAPIIKEEIFKVVVKYPEVLDIRTTLSSLPPIRFGQMLPAFTITLLFSNAPKNRSSNDMDDDQDVAFYNKVLVTLSHVKSSWKNVQLIPPRSSGSNSVECTVHKGVILCPADKWELRYDSRECINDIHNFPSDPSLELLLVIEKIPDNTNNRIYKKSANQLFSSSSSCGTLKILPGKPATLLLQTPTKTLPYIIRDDDGGTIKQDMSIQCLDKWGHKTQPQPHEKWELRTDKNAGPVTMSCPEFSGSFDVRELDLNVNWIRENMNFELNKLFSQRVEMHIVGSTTAPLTANIPYKFDTTLNVKSFRLGKYDSTVVAGSTVDNIRFELLDNFNHPITNSIRLQRLLSFMELKCSWIEEKSKKRGKSNVQGSFLRDDTVLPSIKITETITCQDVTFPVSIQLPNMNPLREELTFRVIPQDACKLVTIIRPISAKSQQTISSIHDGQRIDSIILGIAAADKFSNVTNLPNGQTPACSIVFYDKHGNEVGSQQHITLRAGTFIATDSSPDIHGYIPHLNQSIHCPDGASTAIFRTILSSSSSLPTLTPATPIDMNIVGGVPNALKITWMETTFDQIDSEYYVFNWSPYFRFFPKMSITLKDVRNNVAAMDEDTSCYYDFFSPDGQALITNAKISSSRLEEYSLPCNIEYNFNTFVENLPSLSTASASASSTLVVANEHEEGEIDDKSFRLVVRGVRSSTNETVFSFGNILFKPCFKDKPQDIVLNMSIAPYIEPLSPSIATEHSIAQYHQKDNKRVHFANEVINNVKGMDYYWEAKAADAFPEFIVHLTTEDQFEFLPLKLLDCFTVQCSQVQKSDTISIPPLYTIQYNKAKTAIILRSATNTKLNSRICGQYCVTLTYTERRLHLHDMLQPSLLHISKSFSLQIVPNDICKIKLQQENFLRKIIFHDGPNNMQDQRLVTECGKDVLILEGSDKYGNPCNFTIEDEIRCFIRAKSTAESEQQLVPLLTVTPNTVDKTTLKKHPEWIIGKLTNQSTAYTFGSLSLTAPSTVPDGLYELHFVYPYAVTTTSASQRTDAHLIYEFQYITYSDEYSQRLAELQTIQTSRNNTKTSMDTCKQNFQKVLDSLWSDLPQPFKQLHPPQHKSIDTYDLPSLQRSVQQEYQRLCTERDRIQQQLQQRRQVRYADTFQHPRILPPCNHRGLIGTIATVEDHEVAKLLSFIARKDTTLYIVDNATVEQQFERADLKTYSIASTIPYYVNMERREFRSQHHRDQHMLPLPRLDATRPGNPRYAINLIELSRENEDLRDTIFWEIFGRSIIMNDEVSARRYREEEIRNHRSVPSIHVLGTGKCINSGRNDPSHDRTIRAMFDRQRDYLFFGQSEGIIPSDVLNAIERIRSIVSTCDELCAMQAKYRMLQSEFQLFPVTLEEEISKMKTILREKTLLCERSKEQTVLPAFPTTAEDEERQSRKRNRPSDGFITEKRPRK